MKQTTSVIVKKLSLKTAIHAYTALQKEIIRRYTVAIR